MSGRANYSLPLTEREVLILRLICSGFSLREISESLELEYKTVETHRYNICRKTQARNNALLVRWAIKAGVVEI